MTRDMRLKLTLHNENADEPIHLTSLAPQEGWVVPPPRHLPAGAVATCEISTADDLTVTLHYGSHHIGLHLGNGTFMVDPGDARVESQKLDGHRADLRLALR